MIDAKEEVCSRVLELACKAWVALTLVIRLSIVITGLFRPEIFNRNSYNQYQSRAGNQCVSKRQERESRVIMMPAYGLSFTMIRLSHIALYQGLLSIQPRGNNRDVA